MMLHRILGISKNNRWELLQHLLLSGLTVCLLGFSLWDRLEQISCFTKVSKKFFRMLHRTWGISKSEQWEHIGVSCFPEVSSRDKFIGMCSEDEKRFLLTRQEMEDPTNKWWKDIGETLRRHSPASHECYKAFASLMAGSVYVSSVNPTLCKQELQKEHLEETLHRMGPLNLPDKLKKLKTAEISVLPKFVELKRQPLGSILQIIFWNHQQLDTIRNLDTNTHTIILVNK